MRIATTFIHSQATRDLQRAQTDLVEVQRQAGSERQADDLAGYGASANALISARGYLDSVEANINATQELEVRLSMQDLTLGEVAGAAEDLREAVTGAIAINKGGELMTQLELVFANAVSSLNSSSGGRFVFGGVRDDAPPVTASNLDDLAALATPADAFQNAARKATATLDSGAVIEVAPLADEVGTAMFDVLQRIKQYHDDPTTGPFGENLTDAQADFLKNELATISAVTNDLNQVHAANGGVHSRVESYQERLSGQEQYFGALIADIEGVDLAEVASLLSQTQTQLQAAAQVYASVRSSTLLSVL